MSIDKKPNEVVISIGDIHGDFKVILEVLFNEMKHRGFADKIDYVVKKKQSQNGGGGDKRSRIEVGEANEVVIDENIKRLKTNGFNQNIEYNKVVETKISIDTLNKGMILASIEDTIFQQTGHSEDGYLEYVDTFMECLIQNVDEFKILDEGTFDITNVNHRNLLINYVYDNYTFELQYFKKQEGQYVPNGLTTKQFFTGNFKKANGKTNDDVNRILVILGDAFDAYNNGVLTYEELNTLHKSMNVYSTEFLKESNFTFFKDIFELLTFEMVKFLKDNVSENVKLIYGNHDVSHQIVSATTNDKSDNAYAYGPFKDQKHFICDYIADGNFQYKYEYKFKNKDKNNKEYTIDTVYCHNNCIDDENDKIIYFANIVKYLSNKIQYYKKEYSNDEERDTILNDNVVYFIEKNNKNLEIVDNQTIDLENMNLGEINYLEEINLDFSDIVKNNKISIDSLLLEKLHNIGDKYNNTISDKKQPKSYYQIYGHANSKNTINSISLDITMSRFKTSPPIEKSKLTNKKMHYYENIKTTRRHYCYLKQVYFSETNCLVYYTNKHIIRNDKNYYNTIEPITTHPMVNQIYNHKYSKFFGYFGFKDNNLILFKPVETEDDKIEIVEQNTKKTIKLTDVDIGGYPILAFINAYKVILSNPPIQSKINLFKTLFNNSFDADRFVKDHFTPTAIFINTNRNVELLEDHTKLREEETNDILANLINSTITQSFTSFFNPVLYDYIDEKYQNIFKYANDVFNSIDDNDKLVYLFKHYSSYNIKETDFVMLIWYYVKLLRNKEEKIDRIIDKLIEKDNIVYEKFNELF